MKKNIISFLIIFVFVAVFIIFIRNNSKIINNTDIDISTFVPSDISEIKFNKIEKVPPIEDNGFLQKGFIFFSVIGKEGTVLDEEDDKFSIQTTPIILNIFICNRGSSVVCQDYLSNGIIKNNPGMINKQILIHDRNISYFEFLEKSLDINFEKTKMNSTSYIWCENKYCFQVGSYSEFGDINKRLIDSIIDIYLK